MGELSPQQKVLENICEMALMLPAVTLAARWAHPAPSHHGQGSDCWNLKTMRSHAGKTYCTLYGEAHSWCVLEDVAP